MAEMDEGVRAALVTLEAGRRMVVAGPGAGKTRLLTDRLVRLLGSGVPAREVLVLAFNHAAATELRTRLAKAMPDRGFVELRITTFHSFALSLVDRQWRALGLVARPTLIDEAGRRLVIGELLSSTDDIDGWGRDAEVRSSVAFLDAVTAGLSAEPSTARGTALDRFRERYRDSLRERGLVDLTEVVALAGDLLTDSELARRLGARHVLVDEVQDLDADQHRLVGQLARHAQSTVMVGDPRQSIYGFRNAHPERLQTLSADLGAEVVHLRASHRCRQPVLDAASALVAGQHADVAPLTGVKVDGGIASGVGAIGFTSSSNEMDWIANRLRALHVGGVPWSELAVLCRDTPVTLPAVLAALRRARVPYSADEVTARVPHPWVLRLDDLLDLAVNGRAPADELEAIELASACRLVGADPIAVRAAALEARGSSRPRQALSEWASSDPADPTRERVARLTSALNDAARAHRDGLDASEVAWRLWRNLPVAQQMSTSGTSSEGLGASSAWFERIRAAVEEHPGLRADTYLARGSHDPASDTFLASWVRGGGVAVMTVHQAKGLEWDHVFVPGMVEGRFPVTARSRPLIEANPPETISEERRLLYVAITRARFTATLTCTVGSEERMEAAPSRLFRDLVENLRDPAELFDPPAGTTEPLALVGTRRQAERTWARALRSPTSATSTRIAAARGLATLGTATPWIDAPDTPDDPRPVRTSWKLSATSLKALDGCGLRFFFDRVLRLSPFDGNEQSALGTAVHAGIEEWLGASEQPDRDLLAARLIDNYEQDVFALLPSEALDGPFRRKIDRIATAVSDWFASGRIGAPVLVEELLEHPHSGDITIASRVDLIARNAKGVEIIDWKTGSSRGISVSGDRQLQTYHWLMRRCHPEHHVTKVRLAFATTPKIPSVLATEDYERTAATFIDDMVDRVRTESFDPQPGPDCDLCDFRPICPADQRGQEAPW